MFRDDVSAFLPPGYKQPKQDNETKDPVKTLEGFLTKIRNESSKQNKPKQVDVTPGYNGSVKEPATTADPILSKARPVDVSAFLPPGFKLPKNEEKPNNATPLLAKATPVDISAFLPPGFKLPKGEEKTEEPKSAPTLLSKATPVDVAAFLPPGYKPKEAATTTTAKPKGINKFLAEAEPVDIASFLPPGYTGFKGKFTTKKPPSTTTAVTESSSEATQSTEKVSSTTTSSFKVVFPSRPGGIKPGVGRKLTTPKSAESGPGVQTAPSIHKGWPSR